MRAVRACILGGVGVAAVSFVGAWLGAAETKPTPAKSPDVDQRVKALEEKVAELEKKLEHLSSALLPSNPPAVAPRYGAPRAPIAPPVPPGAQVAPTPPPALELPPGVPPNAIPREFNGQTYYIVPLTKEAPRK